MIVIAAFGVEAGAAMRALIITVQVFVDGFNQDQNGCGHEAALPKGQDGRESMRHFP